MAPQHKPGPNNDGEAATWALVGARHYTGKEYIIERRFMEMRFDFSTSKPLSLREYVAAFETALLDGWHRNTPKETREVDQHRLTLLRWNKQTILVLSPEVATNYMRRYPRLRPYKPEETERKL